MPISRQTLLGATLLTMSLKQLFTNIEVMILSYTEEMGRRRKLKKKEENMRIRIYKEDNEKE